MKTKKLKNWFEIPALWFGTWKMWGERTRDENNDDKKDIAAIRFAIDAGMTAFDSAEMYAWGYSETLLGNAIEWHKREELFISSKVRGDNCSYKATKHACENSLDRMWLEYFDLYYIHWRDASFPLKDTMKALNELVDEGKIKHIWVSNFSVESMQEAQKYCKYPIVANQVHYNLLFREAEVSWLLEYCQKNDVMLVAWRPLEYWEFQNTESMKIFEELSKKYSKTPFQIALNWLITIPNVVTLFKSSNQKNISENMWALWWDLDSDDHQFLSEKFPGRKEVSNAVELS